MRVSFLNRNSLSPPPRRDMQPQIPRQVPLSATLAQRVLVVYMYDGEELKYDLQSTGDG
jgi:hypothetical protein